MKLLSFSGIAAALLVHEVSSASNVRLEQQQTFALESAESSSRELQQGSCNQFCSDPSLCCSQYGFCGSGIDYCDGFNPVSPDVPCGGEFVGNGICADSSLCCSQYGYCGTGTDYCSGGTNPTGPIPSPTPAPIPPLSPVGPIEPLPSDNSRVIAYLGGWTACPTDQQVEQYTHIMLAFAVSYSYSPGKNICSTTCEITTPPVCGNVPRPDLIQKWRSMGKKIILSFGGAGMGGSWDGNNDCWEYCFGRETQVINRLTAIYGELGIDGVDIDYEYYYDDGQNGSGFNQGAAAQFFLTEVTQGLRQSLPQGAEITHAPMDSDMVPGKGYYNVIKNVASSLDFLMPQYYNGITFPGSNFGGALSHFATLRDDVFGGDASKIVFGFCINECSNWNLGGTQAASVMQQLSQASPCNGGAFFWMASYDVSGAWSSTVRNQIQSDSDSAQCGVVVEDPCVDEGTKFEIDVKGNGTTQKKNCKFLAKKNKKKRKKYCKMNVTTPNGKTKKLYKICKETCGLIGKGECSYLKDLQ